MGKFFDKLRNSIGGWINLPGSEPIDEYDDHDDDDQYQDDVQVDRSYRDRTRSRDYDESERELPPLRWKEKTSTSSRQAQNNKILEMHGKGKHGKLGVVIRDPKDVHDAAMICDLLKDDKICVINLTGMEKAMAQRITDFLCGATYAVAGSVKRVSRDTYVIAPEGINITDELQDELEKDGYFFHEARR